MNNNKPELKVVPLIDPDRPPRRLSHLEPPAEGELWHKQEAITMLDRLPKGNPADIAIILAWVNYLAQALLINSNVA